MASDQLQPTGETQSGRRVKYGTNVVIAVAAAVLIVIIINVIRYKRLFRLRQDLTSNSRWSLSEQTRRVVKDLEGEYRLVMLLSQANERRDQAEDLLGEYARLSGNLTVEEINPSSEGRMLAFSAELLERYKDQLEPLKEALGEATKGLRELRADVEQQLELVRKVHGDERLTDVKLKEFIQSAVSAFSRIAADYEDLSDGLAEHLEGALPNYGGAINQLKGMLTNHDEGVFAVVIDRFNGVAEDPGVDDAIKEQLLQSAQGLGRTRQALSQALDRLKSAQPSAEYDELRGQIRSGTVVVIGPPGKPPQVVAVNEMFKSPNAEQLRQAQAEGTIPELTFLGEERITGALVAMSLKEPPLVVFVGASQRGALGPRGEYGNVAARLQKMNFDVQEWPLAGRQGPMGQMMPPGPPPEPKAGQKAVWVVPPMPPMNPMQRNPMGDPGQRVAQHLQERLAAGDAVLVMLDVSPMAGLGMPDAIGDLVKQWQVTPQLDRVIMRQGSGPDRQPVAIAQMDVTQWPDDLPITEAIAGMPGIFLRTCPLVLGTGDGTQVWPLVRVEGKGLWAHTDLNERKPPKFNQDTAADSFTIAAAIEQGANRMVVVCAPAWATNQITGYGIRGLPAELVGVQFPANSELFVNSVYWLTGLEQLIAAGARTQDIRRIAPISAGGVTAIRWTLVIGIPLAIVAAGIAVGLVRRRN